MSSTAILISLVFGISMQIGALQSLSCDGGGPSAFGYDASSVCSKPYNARSSRAYLENLPCDFNKQSWCTVAGHHYPWHAVRRFVQENQGLMRRMYGIERQIDILKAEFDKNHVELEYDDQYEQYLDETRRYRVDDMPEYNYDDDELLGRRYMNRNAGSRNGKNQKRNREPPKGHYRKSKVLESPASTTSSTTSATTLKTTPLTTPEPKISDMNSTLSTVPSATSITVETTTSFEKKSTTDLDEDTEKPATTVRYMEIPDGEEDEINGTTMSTIVDQINENLSINEIPGQIDRLDTNIDELTEIPEDKEVDSEPFDDTSLESEFRHEAATSLNLNSESTQSTKKPLVEAQEFRPRPEYSSENKLGSAKPDNSDTQHYHQDMDNKNQHRETVLKLRGVNACPVKDEVVAPLWANNTRGEVLALINHYPFEQYVHWEKCTHENKQMYCRDGCRCEQQYRLHRLLAFDPNNECRGIFSDWFKFPSCCVCRCYDLPLEFRVTSRSPRILNRKVKIRTPRY